MAHADRPLPRRDAFLSRDTIEHLIARGSKIVIVDGKVLKVDAWLPYHPGGDKAILHMVGKDATDEVNAYVPLGGSYHWNTSESLIGYIHWRLGSE